MTTAELGKMMNVTEADVQSFVACLGVWIAKGYSLEESIERHMAQMTRFVERATDMANDRGIREAAADAVYEELRA